MLFRSGDGGKTRLSTGEPVSKASARVEAYGAVDEVNSAIGVARLHTTADALLDPILSLVPGYGAIERVARLRGRDPDAPPGLSKVTRTL